MGVAGEVEEQRADALVIAVMEKPHLGVLGDPVTHANAPLAAVAGVFLTAITDRHTARQAVYLPTAQTIEFGTGTKGIAAEIVPHRVQFSLFPLVLVVAHQRQVFIQRPGARHLSHRQVGVLGLGAGHVELGGIHRGLPLADVGPEQALAPGHQMPPGLERQVLCLAHFKVAIHIGIQQARGAAAAPSGFITEAIVVPQLVHCIR